MGGMSHSSLRTPGAVYSAVVGALISAAALGAYGAVTTQSSGTEQDAASSQSAPAGTASSAASPASEGAGEKESRVPPFTTADVGACLTWEVDAQGEVVSFGQTDCALPHRFEVSSREDLATYPASEFGPSAKTPDTTRQAQLREELCKAPTVKYLQGRYDPNGRYSIAPILPPAKAWEAGDRTMLCGVQVVDDGGTVTLTEGSARDQDQSRVAQAGQCVVVDPTQAVRVVDCEQPHAMEVTKVVNLKENFPDRVPSLEEQDAFLKDQCAAAAVDYLTDDGLYNSTLEPFWVSIPPESWEGGSNTVNCSLVRDNGQGGFAVLQGSAKGPFTINNAPPPPQPPRNPIRQAPPAPAEAP